MELMMNLDLYRGLVDPAPLDSRPRIAMVSTHGYVAVAPPLGASDTGGQVVYVLELSKKLAQLGFEVDIWTRQFETQQAVEPVADHVRIIRVPCGGSEFIPKEYLYERALGEWVENALRLMKFTGFSYQFINSHYWDAGVASQDLADRLSIPHIHTPHSLGLWKKKQMELDYPGNTEVFEAQYNFRRRISEEQKLFNECQALIATSPQQGELLEEDYQLDYRRIHMIPPGYDDSRFYPVSLASRLNLRQKFGFRGKVILAVGRLARNKGYDLLIRGFAVCASRVPEAVLHLAVGGEKLNPQEQSILGELKKIVFELGLGSRVIFDSYIPDEDLADVYRAADLFVLSSRYEPFGMTAVEAMASGTPTLVTLHGGLFKTLTFGRHALFINPFDPEDVGILMTKVFRLERLNQRLSRMGAHKARSLFTWTGIAQQLVRIVEDRAVPVADLGETGWEEAWEDGD